MMNVRSIAVVFVIVAVLVSPTYAQLGSQSFNKANFSSAASAQAETDLAVTEFSNPGILPNSPFYFLKRLGERIQLFFAAAKDKPFIHLDLAKKRLSEAKRLAELNSTMVKDTLDEFDREINETVMSRGLGQNVSLIKEMDDLNRKSTIVLGLVLEKVPSQAKSAIERALNRSVERSVVESHKKENRNVSKEELSKEVAEEIRKSHERIKKTVSGNKNEGEDTETRVSSLPAAEARNRGSGLMASTVAAPKPSA